MTLHDHPAWAATRCTPLDDPREFGSSSPHRTLAARRLLGDAGGDRDARMVRHVFNPDTMAAYTALGLDPREPLVLVGGASRPACEPLVGLPWPEAA
jgi:hypothetical protein